MDARNTPRAERARRGEPARAGLSAGQHLRPKHGEHEGTGSASWRRLVSHRRPDPESRNLRRKLARNGCAHHRRAEATA